MVKKDKKIEQVSAKAMQNFKLYAQGVKRLKQLEEELNKLDTSNFKHEEKRIRHKLTSVSLIPEIEEDLRKLKLQIAGVDNKDLQSKTDRDQEHKIKILEKQEKEIELQISKIPLVRRKINFIKNEQENIVHHHIPHLREKVKMLERELEAAEALLFSKRSQLNSHDVHNLHQIPALIKIIDLIGKKLRYIHRESEVLESQVKRSIQLTKEEKKDVGKIPLIVQKLGNLKHFFVKKTLAFEEAIPNLVQRVGLIENAIVKTEQIAKTKQLTGSEVKYVDKIPYLKKSVEIIKEEIDKADSSINSLKNNLHLVSKSDRKNLSKISYLRQKVNDVELILEKETEKIPLLQRKTLSLGKRVNEEEKEIKGIEKDVEKIPYIYGRTWKLGKKVREEEEEIKEVQQKVDDNRLKFHEEMVNEIVESRRMLENGKQEIRQQLLDLLAEAVHRLNERNEQADKNILAEIEKLKENLEKSKNEVNQKVNSKISNIDVKLHKDENEFDKKILEEINLLREEIQKNKDEVNKKINTKISYVHQKFNNDESEFDKKIVNEALILKNELEKNKNSSNQKIYARFHEVDQKVDADKLVLEKEMQDKIEVFRKNLEDQLRKEKIREEKLNSPQLTSKGLEFHSKNQYNNNPVVRDALFDITSNNIAIAKREPMFMKRITELEKSMKTSHMSKAELKKINSAVTEEREALPKPFKMEFAEIKKEVENKNTGLGVKPKISDTLSPTNSTLPAPLLKFTPELKSKEKTKKLKIPKKMFFEYEHFAELANEIAELKEFLNGEAHEVIENIASKKEDFESEMEQVMTSIEKTRLDLKKMHVSFSSIKK